MAAPVWPTVPENQFMPPPAFVLRARREVPTLDAANARLFEHWRTDTPSMTLDRPQPGSGKGPRHQDMNPEASRTNFKNYSQAQPFVPGGGELGQNPYFQKYDVTQDPRNVVRELRNTVSEDKTDRGLVESKDLLGRAYVTRWLPTNYVGENSLDTLSAYDKVMKKQTNDMSQNFRQQQHPSNQK